MGIHSDLTTMFQQVLAIHPTPVTFGDEPDSRVLHFVQITMYGVKLYFPSLPGP